MKRIGEKRRRIVAQGEVLRKMNDKVNSKYGGITSVTENMWQRLRNYIYALCGDDYEYLKIISKSLLETDIQSKLFPAPKASHLYGNFETKCWENDLLDNE